MLLFFLSVPPAVLRMKIALCLFVVVLVVSIEALPQDVVSRIKRGFRNGAADRFSHGFGKRAEGDNLLSGEQTSR